MSARLAILCSGQGGQGTGMLPLLQSDALAWQCWQALEQDWREAGFAGTNHAINSTDFPSWQALLQQESRFHNRYAQVLVVAFGLAAWQALQPVLPHPTLVAGYSVGEMTALAVAGALEYQTVLRLTQQRAMCMDAAASAAASAGSDVAAGAVGSAAAGVVVNAASSEATNLAVGGTPGAASGPFDQVVGEPRDQGLLALTGTPWRVLESHILAAGAFIAIDNGEQSCVLGGYRDALTNLAPQLRALGGQTQEVAVSVAAHTPLLASAAAPFLHLLQQQTWQRARCPALAALDARRLIRFESGCASMAQALHDTIHWADAMDALAEGGIGVALELGPGSNLTRMLQQRHPGIACRSLVDFRSLQAAREWVEKQLAS